METHLIKNYRHHMLNRLQFIQRIKKAGNTHKQYILNLTTTFISQSAGALSLLILTPILFRELGTEAFSWYGVLLNIVVLSAFLDFGMNTSLLRRIIHEPQRAQELISVQFFFFIGIGIASIPAYYFLLHRNSSQSDIAHAVTSICIATLVTQQMLAVLFDVIIQSVNKIFLGRMIRIGKVVLELFLLLLVVKKGSVLWLLSSSILINTIYILVLMYYARKNLSYKLKLQFFSFSILAEHFRYSSWYFLAILATVLTLNSQMILLASLVSAAFVAKYVLVSRFYDVVRTGLVNFTIILFPKLISIQADGDWKVLKKIHQRMMIRIAGLCILTFCIINFIGEPLFILWSGQSSNDILELFRLYAVFVLLLVADSVSAIFLSALKWNKIQTIVAIIQGVLSLVLSYYLIPLKGISGLAIASIIALIFTNFIFNPVYLIIHINRKIQAMQIESA